MFSSSRLFVTLFVLNAVLVLVLDIVANIVPNLLPVYITQSPLVVGLLLVGLLAIVLVLGLAIQRADAQGYGDYLSTGALRSFSAFAGIAVGIAAGIVLAPTAVDYGERVLKFASTYFTSASIRLDPLSGPPGTSITVTGSHFRPDAAVVVFVENTPMDGVRTDDEGAFDLQFRFPDASEGEYQSNKVAEVTAINQEAGREQAVATFVVKMEG